jgi:predicted nuclease of predicted toxin-antitoxin system
MRFLTDENIHADVIRKLRQANYDVFSVQDVGLSGHKDHEILEYSEKQDLILISGDKDFGGLIKFGTLWGHGRVILLRYNLINVSQMVQGIVEVVKREAEILGAENPVVIVLSESGYRIRRPGS